MEGVTKLNHGAPSLTLRKQKWGEDTAFISNAQILHFPFVSSEPVSLNKLKGLNKGLGASS